MKKFQVPLLWAVILILALHSFTNHRQVIAARQQTAAAAAALLNYHPSAAINYLFDHTRATPSKENLAALTYALIERRQKYNALIFLYHHQVDESTWRAFGERPAEQATVFFLNLSLKADISEEDWALFDRIAEVWRQHEEYLKMHMTGLQVSNPTSLTYEYIRLIQQLDKVFLSK